MRRCHVSGCDRPANHSQLHNVIEALDTACEELDSLGASELADELRAIGMRSRDLHAQGKRK